MLKHIVKSSILKLSCLLLFIPFLANKIIVNDDILLRKANLCVQNFKCIELEVASAPESRRNGLMERPYIFKDSGMLFLFDYPAHVSFWMYKVHFPLDIIFIREGKIVDIKSNFMPCIEMPCNVYSSKEKVDSALEILAGQAEILNLSVGDKLKINFN